MPWYILCLLTALFESLKDVTSKQSLRFFDEYWVTWATQITAVLCLLPLLWWQGIPPIGPDFGKALIAGGSLNMIAFVLYVKAIKQADLSLTVPLVTLTPLFLLLTSPLIVDEKPSGLDIVGVILIVIGSYILNVNAKTAGGFMAPLRSLVQNPGCRKMLLVALLWSLTSNFDKVGVVNSSPMFWSVTLLLFIAAGLTPLLLYRWLKARSSEVAPPNWQAQMPLLLSSGLLGALAIGFQMAALPLTSVAQVIAVKRLSSLFSVGFGHVLFGETGLRERLSGAVIMVSGVVLMSVF
jgi:drug/metabolite transporter (DMT)-like permease